LVEHLVLLSEIAVDFIVALAYPDNAEDGPFP
jgi:hypothetical protein